MGFAKYHPKGGIQAYTLLTTDRLSPETPECDSTGNSLVVAGLAKMAFAA